MAVESQLRRSLMKVCLALWLLPSLQAVSGELVAKADKDRGDPSSDAASVTPASVIPTSSSQPSPDSKRSDPTRTDTAKSDQDTSARLSFELPTPSGTLVGVRPGTNRITAVVFLGTQCPMARAYASKLSELQTQHSSTLHVVGVMSNQQDSKEDVQQYIDSLDALFDIVLDEGNVVADRYGATRTPEAFLLDEDLKLRYHGRIDDQFAPSVTRGKADREDLRIAVDELLAGKVVAIKETTALGCLIGKVKERRVTIDSDSVTFDQIVPILNRNCVECHRQGEIGPFAMDSYEEVVGWADTMWETIEDGRMPPWNADPNIGEFSNARHMSSADKELFHAWMTDGYAPAKIDKETGGITDLAVEEVVVHQSESSLSVGSEKESSGDVWQFDGEPDVVLSMRERPFVIPKDGIVEYQYFVVDPEFKEDKWVKNAQIIPGSRDVVHHCIVFIRPPDGTRFQGVGWLTGYVPGQRALELPPGRARKIPAGSKLVFQMHYTPNGVRREDTTRVGLQFANPADVTDEVFSVVALNQEFEIPPETDSYSVSAQVRQLPRRGELLAITPHMHYRGKSFTAYADYRDNKYANGESASIGDGSGNRDDESARDRDVGSGQSAIPLLRVPNYDFNWQHTYALAEPMPLEHIERVHFDATFDNSVSNPFNPDATEWVTWGDQTWEEMAVSFFEVSVPRASKSSEKHESHKSLHEQTVSSEIQAKRNAYVEKVFKQLDSNGDRVIQKSEGTIFFRHFSFDSFDSDRDGQATEREVRKIAEWLYR